MRPSLTQSLELVTQLDRSTTTGKTRDTLFIDKMDKETDTAASTDSISSTTLRAPTTSKMEIDTFTTQNMTTAATAARTNTDAEFSPQTGKTSLSKSFRMTGAQFIDQVTIDGHVAFKWDKPGLQHNYYYESTEDEPENRVVLGIDQQPNDFQLFNLDSFSKTFNDTLTKPPAACNPNKSCPLTSICTAVKYF